MVNLQTLPPTKEDAPEVRLLCYWLQLFRRFPDTRLRLATWPEWDCSQALRNLVERGTVLEVHGPLNSSVYYLQVIDIYQDRHVKVSGFDNPNTATTVTKNVTAHPTWPELAGMV